MKSEPSRAPIIRISRVYEIGAQARRELIAQASKSPQSQDGRVAYARILRIAKDQRRLWQQQQAVPDQRRLLRAQQQEEEDAA